MDDQDQGRRGRALLERVLEGQGPELKLEPGDRELIAEGLEAKSRLKSYWRKISTQAARLQDVARARFAFERSDLKPEARNRLALKELGWIKGPGRRPIDKIELLDRFGRLTGQIGESDTVRFFDDLAMKSGAPLSEAMRKVRGVPVSDDEALEYLVSWDFAASPDACKAQLLKALSELKRDLETCPDPDRPRKLAHLSRIILPNRWVGKQSDVTN